MTRRPSADELDRILEEWLVAPPDRVPDRVLAEAFAATRTMRPRPRLLARLERWRPGASGRGRQGALALAIVALGGLGVVAAGGLRSTDPRLLPTDPAPSPVSAERDPDALRGTWIGVPPHDPAAPDASQGWVLRLGSFATLQGPGGELQVLQGFEADGGGLRLPGGTSACAGVSAEYRWRVTDDRLTLIAADDPCPDRRAPLERFAWQRVPDGWLVANRFRAPFAAPPEPALAVGEVTTTLHSFGGWGVDAPSGVAAWVIEEVVDDPCPPPGTLPRAKAVAPGPDALIAALRGMANVTVSGPDPVTAGGLGAVRVSVAVTGRGCAGSITARLWEDQGTGVGQGTTSTGQYLELVLGGAADLYLVDVEGLTVAFVTWSRDVATWGPATTPERLDLLQRVRFYRPSP